MGGGSGRGQAHAPGYPLRNRRRVVHRHRAEGVVDRPIPTPGPGDAVIRTTQALIYACDMLSTGLIGAENAAIPVGGSVAIFAQGAVGLSATLGARLRGAGLVITVEGLPNRQELSRRFGADVVIDPASGDVAEQIQALTDGGADSTVEALGNQVTFEGALYATRPGGTLSNVGYHGESGPTVVMPLDAWGSGMAGKKIVTDLCPGGRLRMARLMRLLSNGKIDPTPMTTHRMGIDDVEEAFDMMTRKLDGIVKPLITF